MLNLPVTICNTYLLMIKKKRISDSVYMMMLTILWRGLKYENEEMLLLSEVFKSLECSVEQAVTSWTAFWELEALLELVNSSMKNTYSRDYYISSAVFNQIDIRHIFHSNTLFCIIIMCMNITISQSSLLLLLEHYVRVNERRRHISEKASISHPQHVVLRVLRQVINK